MDHAINAPGNGNNFVGGINATENIYLQEQMELIGKLGRKGTSKIGMIPSASKDISIKISDKCIHISMIKNG